MTFNGRSVQESPDLSVDMSQLKLLPGVDTVVHFLWSVPGYFYEKRIQNLR